MQSLGNDLFTHEWAVGIRGVDEIDSQFHGAPHHSYGLGPIRGLTPDSFARDPHCAISKPRDAQIVSNHEFAGFPGKPLLLFRG